MSDWHLTKLGDATISLDSQRKPVKAPDRTPGPYPYYGASGIVDYVDSWIFDETTLLVSEDGENLRSRKTPIAFLASGRYWVNNHAHVLQAGDGFDLRFLNYALQIADINGHLTGSTQPKLTARNLGNIRILAPDHSEQVRIASVLSSLDALIEHDRTQIDRLAGLARAVPKRVESSVSLDVLAQSLTVRHVRPTGAAEHYSLPAFDDRVTPELIEGERIKSNKIPLKQPTVLVSRLNPKWERCWMSYPGDNAVASTEFVPLIGGGAAAEEIWAVTSTNEFWDQMRTRVTGTTGSHQRVDKAAVLKLFVPDVRALPSKTREQIVDLVRMIQACRDEIADLTRARDELLPQLMSGKIHVDEAMEVA